MGERVSHEVVIGAPEELVDGCFRERLRVCPVRKVSKRRKHRLVRRQEETTGLYPCLRPICKLVGVVTQLRADLLNAEDGAIRIRLDQLIPEGRNDVESVVLVLGLNEHISVKQVRHYSTPSLSASS
jgi:hypothetical protein